MKQNEIWLIDLEPTKGSEMQKIRPAIIVSDDSLGRLPLKIIVPITDWKDRYEIAPWMIYLKPNNQNGLNKNSAVDCFQVRSLSQERLIKRVGSVDADEMKEIKEGLKIVLSL